MIMFFCCCICWSMDQGKNGGIFMCLELTTDESRTAEDGGLAVGWRVTSGIDVGGMVDLVTTTWLGEVSMGGMVS